MKLTFLGATQTVTGSKYHLDTGQSQYLVDCGLFQGLKALRLRNWSPLPIDARKIEALILTHAHIDHSGYIPLLVKQGFNGPIYASHATRSLCKILLPDSGSLQEEEARYANKYGYSKHAPALPLYTRKDAIEALKQFSPVNFEQSTSLDINTTFRLIPAGHILGASFVELTHRGMRLLFSGDMGRYEDPIMYPPSAIYHTDYLVLESTYGDRTHKKQDPMVQLETIINQTVKRRGVVLIPSFAVGRAQAILYYLYQLQTARRIPNVPIYVDSPMTTNVTEVFYQYADQHRLSMTESAEVCKTADYVTTPQESKALNQLNESMIIISASGMATGGRVLHHLKAYAPHRNNTILFVGYQAAGTRGARMVAGDKHIKLLGQMVPVRASVRCLDNMSAHADYRELLTWCSHFKTPPKKVFITHGEPDSAGALKQHIEQTLGWHCQVPHYLDEVDF